MLRRLFYLVMLAVTLSSCGNYGSKNITTQNEESMTYKVTFDSLIANPENYIGKTISIEGKVVHVCTETGKKMFITGQNPDVRLFVAAGDKISKFPMELLGNEITVEGLITRAPGGEGSEPEMHAGKNMEMSGDSCETEKAMSGQLSLADIRMQYSSHTVK